MNEKLKLMQRTIRYDNTKQVEKNFKMLYIIYYVTSQVFFFKHKAKKEYI